MQKYLLLILLFQDLQKLRVMKNLIGVHKEACK